MYLQDKPNNNWSQFTDNSMTIVRYDDDSEEAFTLSHIVMTFGKYNGTLLSDIDDVSYLEWLAKSDNEFQVVMAQRRLAELDV